MIQSMSLLILGGVPPSATKASPAAANGATTVEIVSVIALFAGPVIAVVISVLLSHWIWNKANSRGEVRNEKLYILRVLMASRHSIITDVMTQAHNMIDLAFRDTPPVLSAWHKYYDMLHDESLNNLGGYEKCEKQRMAMLHEMVKALGCDKGLSQWDVDRVYRPKGLVDDEAARQSINQELLRILKTTRAVATLPIANDPQAKRLDSFLGDAEKTT
jgi:hypothetical protein